MAKKITEEQAIALLRKHAPSESVFEIVLKHVTAVQKVAVRIAEKCHGVDMHIIRIGSLLHDIGRSSCPPGKDRCRHGIVGAETLRMEGLDEAFAKICERHIGVGITKEDIIEQNLPLPKKDFVPITKVEKIIAHADNFIFGFEEKTFEDVLNRFRKELGEEYVERAIKLKEEIDGMMKS